MKTKKLMKEEIKKSILILTKKMQRMTPGSYEHQRTAEDIKTLTEALKELEQEELKKERLKDITQILITALVVGFELKHIFTGKSFNLIPKR